MSRGRILTTNVGRRASTFRNPDQLRNAEGQIGQLNGLSTSAFNAQNRTPSPINSPFFPPQGRTSTPYISPLGSFAKGEQTYSNIEKMFAEIRGDGFARPNRFEALFFPPTGRTSINPFQEVINRYASNADGTLRTVQIKCQSIQFPGRTVDVKEDTNIYGPTRSVVTGYSYGDVSATFLCSNDMKEKLFFEVWQRLSFNPQTWAMGYYNNYVGTIQINQLDQDDQRQYGVALMDCFPKDIGSQELNQSTRNAISTITVTFSYRYWKSMIDEESLPKPIDNRTDLGASRVNEANVPSIFQRLFR